MKTVKLNLAVPRVPENLTPEQVAEILQMAIEMGFSLIDEKGMDIPLGNGGIVVTPAA